MSTVHDFATYANAFELGLTKVHKDELKLIPKEYASWLEEKKAMHYYDTEWVVSGVGVMPSKEIGADITTDQILDGPTKRHGMAQYAIALVIQYEVIRWDLYNIFKPLAGELARSAVDRHNMVAYDFFNEAFNASANAKYLTFQSEAPCSTTHTRLDGGTWSNRLTNNEGLSFEGIQKALIVLKKTVNERGRYGRLEAQNLVVPTDLRWLADIISTTTGRPHGALNDRNTLKGRFRSHDSNYINQLTYWFLTVRKSEPCFKVCMRIGDRPDLQRDSDIRSRNRIMTSYCSFEFATFDTRGMVGSSGGA